MKHGRLSPRALASWRPARPPNWRLWLVIGLVLACLATAMLAVKASHETREQYARLQQLERERDQLQTEWGQLLLEESAWSSPARTERLAVERLDMRLPHVNEVEVIRP
ncbi:cell division protein FtsL [Billgrantia kenyensis]|jgi:cell division protein FtsL|uniref:Cell division protein FtsL n=1 Tax=Billgrantia kenyensis TaxID=321266 RepID=A0A7V9W0G2_9GAMM|nr:cell division protein FtsL [Halomonas kenyensis]MBA2778769.1 cell division protein FtsL [Halomonas kenyensis]MCG6661831.1 cell division protein FtsL [Halomonas kenyensis]